MSTFAMKPPRDFSCLSTKARPMGTAVRVQRWAGGWRWAVYCQTTRATLATGKAMTQKAARLKGAEAARGFAR